MARGSWLLVPLLLMTVCNRLLSSQHAISVSPDGLAKLIVWIHWNGPDSSVSVHLYEPMWPERTILSDPVDRWPGLTEVHWDIQSTRVGVLVCDSLAGNILFAFDLDQRKAISPEVAAGIRESLVSRYHLMESRLEAYKGDPIACACDAKSGNFRRLENIIGDKSILPPLGSQR